MTDEVQTESVQSLDSIIKGSESTQTEEVGQEAVTKEPEVETAKVEKKSETTSEDKESWTKTAVLDERRKRQELEAKLAKYEEEKVEKIKRPDVLEDQEGAFQHTESAFENKLFQERINLTRELMMEAKPDYSEMAALFLEMVKENPSLESEIRNSSNPAKFAYNKAKEKVEYNEFQKTKETPEYKQFLEAKKSGKLNALVEETPEQKRNKSALNVPDLINSTSAKSGHTEGEKTLSQILKKRK